MTVAESRIEDMDDEGNRLLGKMLEGPVRYSVRDRSLADLEAPNGFLKLVRGG